MLAFLLKSVKPKTMDKKCKDRKIHSISYFSMDFLFATILNIMQVILAVKFWKKKVKQILGWGYLIISFIISEISHQISSYVDLFA